MTDDEFFDATPELKLIKGWARARYAAPWAVLGAVLLRVAATTEPTVQLPGLIGGPASLNLMAAFVAPSGGGKGISDKVARLAWPADITERPIGSGEGIAALFMPPKKEGQERITRAILSVPEIDTMAGIAKRQGAILLAQLKSMVMGELIGQSNASEATSRVVQPHTYRCCLSVGAQPGHTSVIFDDTTGGTPQRMLWFPTVDPDMPENRAPDPQPLNTKLPSWARTGTEMTYGPDEIAQTVITSHIARQRGDMEALDGHALLTRCKVAAVIAVMHHRSVVSELDWQLSSTVMAVSDRTRNWILAEAKRAERAKVRERAIARADGDAVYDNRLLDGVKNSILRTLERDGEQAGNVLRSRMGKRDRRDMFDQAIALLEHEGKVVPIEVERGSRYRLSEVQGEPPVQGAYQQLRQGEPKVQGEPFTNVTDLDTRRSHDADRPKLSCPKWLAHHIADLQNTGHTTTDSLAIHAAGKAAGHSIASISNAITANPTINETGRNGLQVIYDITGKTTNYTPLPAWVHSYVDTLIRDGIDVVDKDAFKTAATAAGHNWESAARSLRNNGRIESEPDPTGNDTRKTIWRIIDATEHGGTAS